MLVKLLLKIVFKASLPLVAVAGILSYGLYLKGGDPISMWSSVASRAMGSIRESGANTVQSVQALAPTGSVSTTSTTVYTWVDVGGITHYGSNPPAGVAAKTMRINTRHPTAVPQPTQAAAMPQQALPEPSEKLPGVSGVKLPINIQPEELGLKREDLLKMIGQ